MDCSVVIPVYNEEECLEGLTAQLHEVLAGLDRQYEIIFVDDGSTDGTRRKLGELAGKYPCLRVVALKPNSGQSAALGVGFGMARGDVIVTLDGDGQNDPADIPRLLDALSDCDMCCGYRAQRHDSWSRRMGGRLANTVRNRVLGEAVIDTGCTLKAVKARFVRDLTMLDGMHRFIPALVAMQGGKIEQIPVSHHPRTAGESKYTNLGRLRTVIADLLAVRWMRKRYRTFEVEAD
jgi:glycosyltransferase involved in cell wall biosynthesis